MNKSSFAVITTGGKQYCVSVGDIIDIEKLKGEYNEGDKVVFDQVLLIDDGKDLKVGTPTIEKATVSGEIVKIGRKKKINVIKYKSKSNYRRKIGHRQHFFRVKIGKI